MHVDSDPAVHVRAALWRRWRFFVMLLTLCIAGSTASHARDVPRDTSRTPTVASSKVPLVYIDCDRCDYNYIRSEINFVNYVRDPEQADVHVFITDERTGGGGREYALSFIGQRRYADTDHTLTQTVGRNATWSETRESLNQVLKMGLVPYVMRTPVASGLSISYEQEESEVTPQQSISDPWDYWVFEVYAGRVSMGLESNQTEFDSRWGFFADRVTENWKTHLRSYFNFSYDAIEQANSDPVTSRRHRHGFNSRAIMSLNDHWSAGLFGNYLTRNDRNINHRFRVNPGIEYSVFPYEEATRKAITFVYRVGYTRADYYEQTIFGQNEESLINQELEASVSTRQPWGDIYTGLSGSHYFHDFSARRLEFFSRVSVRIAGGLSLFVRTDFEMIQDQLSLPAGETSLEDVLLQQRELATDFSLSGSVAISYTFGSEFANVVNTRF